MFQELIYFKSSTPRQSPHSKRGTIFPYSLPFPTTIFTTPPRFATAGSRFTFAAARFDFSSSSVADAAKENPDAAAIVAPTFLSHQSPTPLLHRPSLPEQTSYFSVISSPRSAIVTAKFDPCRRRTRRRLHPRSSWSSDSLVVARVVDFAVAATSSESHGRRHPTSFQISIFLAIPSSKSVTAVPPEAYRKIPNVSVAATPKRFDLFYCRLRHPHLQSLAALIPSSITGISSRIDAAACLDVTMARLEAPIPHSAFGLTGFQISPRVNSLCYRNQRLFLALKLC